MRLPLEEYSILTNSVLSRDGFKCRSCGFRGNLTAHHMRFRSQGGEDTMDNLVTLCSACHRGIHEERGLHIEGDDANAHLIFIRKNKWWPK